MKQNSETKKLPQSLSREFSFNTESIDAEQRKVRVSFSSEEPYERWFGVEILAHSEDSIDLTRLKEIGVSLFNHNRDFVIGKLENIFLDTTLKKCYCDIIFDDDEESDKIFKKVLSGTLKGVSVGYTVSAWEEVDANKKSMDGRFQGPCSIAIKWQPFEVSIVSVPADSTVGVGRELEEIIVYKKEKEERKNQMTNEDLQKRLDDFEAKMMKILSENRAEKSLEEEQQQQKELEKAVADEKTRLLEISNLCREFDLDAKECFEKTLEEVKSLALKEKTKVKTPAANIEIKTLSTEEDHFRAAVSDGLIMRAGYNVSKATEGAQAYRSMSLKKLALLCLQRNGEENAFNLSDRELFEKSLAPSSAFMSIVDNVASKSLSDYAAAATTYQYWCGKGSVSDFKDAAVYRMSEAGNLELVPEGGEVKFDKLKDTKVTKRVATYGKKFGLTREAFINDDLDVITKMPAKYVNAAYGLVNTLVYDILKNNTAIGGTALFHANHGNLAGTGAALSSTTLAAARAAMRKQKDFDNKRALNITPKFLIVSPDLEVAAAQLLTSVADPSGSNSGVANFHKNSMDLIVDAELTGNAWYLAADPTMCDTIEVTALSGYETPVLSSRVSTDFLGIEYEIIYDVGVNLLDYKGLYKNAGA